MPHMYLRNGRVGSIVQFMGELSRYGMASDRMYRAAGQVPAHYTSFVRLHQDRCKKNLAPFVRGEVWVSECNEKCGIRDPLPAASSMWKTSFTYIEHSDRSKMDPHPLYPNKPGIIGLLSLPKPQASDPNKWVTVMADWSAWVEGDLRAEGIHADVHSLFVCPPKVESTISSHIHVSVGIAPIFHSNGATPTQVEELFDMMEFIWLWRGQRYFHDRVDHFDVEYPSWNQKRSTIHSST